MRSHRFALRLLRVARQLIADYEHDMDTSDWLDPSDGEDVGTQSLFTERNDLRSPSPATRRQDIPEKLRTKFDLIDLIKRHT